MKQRKSFGELDKLVDSDPDLRDAVNDDSTLWNPDGTLLTVSVALACESVLAARWAMRTGERNMAILASVEDLLSTHFNQLNTGVGYALDMFCENFALDIQNGSIPLEMAELNRYTHLKSRVEMTFSR